MIQQLGYVTSQRIVVLGFNLEVQGIVQVVQLDGTVHVVVGVIDFDDRVVLLHVVLVLDVSDDFLNEILDGNKSNADSVFVKHDGHGVGIRFHGVQKIVGLLVFVYIQWLSHDVADTEIVDIVGRLVEEEILNMENTDHVVPGILIYRNSCVWNIHVQVQQFVVSHIH